MSPGATERFKEADAQFAIPKLPKSSRKDQVVHVGAKVLTTKKYQKKVVPEEQYVENLRTIIQRDYFPDLKKLRIQNQYLEAILKGDEATIRELQVKYAIKKPINATPALSDFNTPSTSYSEAATPSSSAFFPFANAEGDNDKVFQPKQKKKALDKFTVQSFLQTYTGEDNASFEELSELMQERERKKYAWMYEAEKKHNAELVTRMQQIENADEQLLAIQNGTVDKPIELDNWSYTTRNYLLFNPGDEAPLTKKEFVQRLKENDFTINKKATRIDKEDSIHAKPVTMARAALFQAANHIGKVDVTGKDLGIVDAETLGCVATPMPDPGVEESPLMTWGMLDGTPFRLDGDDDPIAFSSDAPMFRMPDIPIRDKIRDSMTETIGKRYTDKRKFALKTAANAHEKTPKYGSTRAMAGELSSAARKLMVNKLGIKAGSASSIFDSSNNFSRSSRTRTPGSVRSTTSSVSSTPRYGTSSSIRDMIRTPGQKRAAVQEDDYPQTPEHQSNTKRVAKQAVAGLLNLQPNVGNKRPRAVDFE